MWKQLRLFWFSRNLYLSIYCAWVKRALEKKNTVELWFYFYSFDIALLVVIFFMITCLLWLPSLASLLQNVLCTEVSSSHLSCFTAGFRVFHFFCFIHVLTSLFELNVSVKCSLPTLTSKAAAFLSQQSELSTNIKKDLDQSNQVDFRCISSSRHPRIDLSPHAFLSLDFISPPLVSILLYHSLSYASTKPEPSSVFRRQQAIKESVCAVRQSWWVICSSCVYHVDAHSWKCANDEERTISCVCAHVCSRSLAEVCVCAFVLSLTGVSVSAGVQLCANVLTVRYQSVKGVASMRIYRSSSSARYRRLTAQSMSFGVFVSCLWSDISLCQQEMDNIPSTGSVRWSCAVWVDFPHRFLITSANVSVFSPRSTCR